MPLFPLILPSSQKGSNTLLQISHHQKQHVCFASNDFSRFRHGDPVKYYAGCRWIKATVVAVSHQHCIHLQATEPGPVTVYDARNVMNDSEQMIIASINSGSLPCAAEREQTRRAAQFTTHSRVSNNSELLRITSQLASVDPRLPY